MTRNIKPHEAAKRAKAQRAHALSRVELREPTSPRVSAAGPTSLAIKVMDAASAAAIEAYLREKR
jgi:hypothetical protein